MAKGLEFEDDFSFRGLFGKKKKKENDDTHRIPIYNEQENLLPPPSSENQSKKYNTHVSGAYTDLDYPLIAFSQNQADVWRLSDAVRGVQIFGGIGSGKSSASGKLLALTFLKNGFGGLVLCGKPDERENWEKYARLTGRSKDLIIFDRKSGYQFNPLIYELTRQSEGAGETSNIVNLFMSIYKLGARINGSEARSSERFWDNALRRLLSRTIDLLKLSQSELSIRNIVDVVTSAPSGQDFIEYVEQLNQEELEEQEKSRDESTEEVQAETSEEYYPASEYNEMTEEQTETTQENQEEMGKVEAWYLSSYCTACIWVASDNILSQEEIDAITNIEQQEAEQEKAELFEAIKRYFLKELATLAPETRSSLLETLFGITEPFRSGILAKQFSRSLHSEVKPELTFDNEEGTGKILIIDFPVKNYLEAGIYAQGIYKLLWQQAVERRKIEADERAVPVFLWADESQFFVSEYDMLFQTTARSSRACTVFLTQNISNYYAMMGGESSRARVDSLLGNLSTKIFHANNDFETNQWAANTIGKIFQIKDSSGFAFQMTKDGVPSVSSGASEQLHYQIEPREFTTLKTGGKENKAKVEAIIITAGKKWFSSDHDELLNYKHLEIDQSANQV